MSGVRGLASREEVTPLERYLYRGKRFPTSGYQRRPYEPETRAYMNQPSPGLTWQEADANIKAIKNDSGITLVAVTANLSQVDGSAFVSNPSVDLRPYVGFKSTWSDAGVGWIKAAGTGETLGGERVSAGGTFAGWTFGVGWTTDGVTLNGDGSGNATLAYKNLTSSFAIGQLTKAVVDITARTSGSVGVRTNNVIHLSGLTTVATHTGYKTIIAVDNMGYAKSALFLGSVDNISIQQVLTPSATGVTIASTKGGTQNWGTQGTTPNAATFDVTITLT